MSAVRTASASAFAPSRCKAIEANASINREVPNKRTELSVSQYVLTIQLQKWKKRCNVSCYAIEANSSINREVSNKEQKTQSHSMYSVYIFLKSWWEKSNSAYLAMTNLFSSARSRFGMQLTRDASRLSPPFVTCVHTCTF